MTAPGNIAVPGAAAPGRATPGMPGVALPAATPVFGSAHAGVYAIAQAHAGITKGPSS